MSKKILVVDDSAVVRQSVEFVLKDNGYEVILAVDGQDGLNKAKADSFQLIISDINMPNMDGLTMISEIRATDAGKYVPILVLTTESDADMLQKGKSMGASGWIVKPFSNDKLLETVSKVIA